MPDVKCIHSIQLDWSRYRDTGVNNPAPTKYQPEKVSKSEPSSSVWQVSESVSNTRSAAFFLDLVSVMEAWMAAIN